MAGPSVLPLLERGLNPYERKLDARLLAALAAGFPAWAAARGRAASAADLVEFLRHEIKREVQHLTTLRQQHAEFTRRYHRAVTEEERRQHVLDHARDLGATRRQLRGDRKAFARWFGHDAVTDRFVRRQGAAERRLAFCLQRLGVLAAQVLEAEPPGPDQEACWRRLDLEDLVRPLLTHDGDGRVSLGAFRCLARALQAVAPEAQEQLADDGTLTFVYRAAADARQDVWIQCEALGLLRSLSPSSFRKVVELRLQQPAEGDDLFVRRHAVRLLDADLAELLPAALRDPSPFVRQEAAHALARVPGADLPSRLRQLAREDPLPQVRAAAVLEGLTLLRRPECGELARAMLHEVMEQEKSEFVLRVAIHVAVEGTLWLVGAESEPRTSVSGGVPPLTDVRGSENLLVCEWRQTVERGLNHLHTSADSLAVRRWAALARERIWCATEPRACRLHDALRQALDSLPPGRSRRLPRGLLRGCDDDLAGRVLAVLAQQDFGFDLERRWWGARVTRGHVFRFRLWRFLHELRHPDPAKRQGFAHTVGRVSYARVRAPSAIMAELAETKVPGEPLFMAKENGWRPYLPLPDDVLSCLNQLWAARPVRFYTAEGVTELRPPRAAWRRLRAWLRIHWSFAYYARLRNWREGDQANPAAYLHALARLGIEVCFRPHKTFEVSETSEVCFSPADPAVARFFPAAASVAAVVPVDLGTSLRELWQAFGSYFSSLYENNVRHLLLFTAVALALFLGRHWYLNFSLRRARNRLPLVLGGWGTRGKSGTERLKAALVNALGGGLISKTTGCEAMFLHAHPFGKTREMFLYRSYDKATIWEQRQVVRVADALDADVFLWECMALRPSYVHILQCHWMRDDVSTITNTYPDHEDIQGPAGINIPEVIAGFIPPRSRLLTSEEQMRPILEEVAKERGTPLRGVGWLEAGLLPPDVLKRFPYEEHPYNIALVLALADELGLDRAFAVKEMADRVVADLGVLKTAPPAPLRARRLEFSNGMSANERHGCLNNWYRLGFDRQDPEAEPGVWVTTVVNNRADRIPRSRVFAGVLVNDLSADRHFLIGGNLTGLVSYIEESWQEYVQAVTLWPETGERAAAEPLRQLEQLVRRFRQPLGEASVRARLRVMLEAAWAARSASGGDSRSESATLEALWNDPDELRRRLTAAACDARLTDSLIGHLTQDLKALEEYRALAEKVRDAEPTRRGELDQAVRELLGKWFRAKLVVISDYYAPGDAVVEHVAEETPPGFLNRVMGIQNIKGTGLDFVYRWEAWHACHRACTMLRSPEPARTEQGLRDLAAFQDYGLLCEEYVRETVECVRPSPLAQGEAFQAQLRLILTHLDTKLAAVRERLRQDGSRGGGWLAGLCGLVEAFLDAGDAVKRRRRADRIYKDLIAERISHERAALELQELIKRQKGGWLVKKLSTGSATK